MSETACAMSLRRRGWAEWRVCEEIERRRRGGSLIRILSELRAEGFAEFDQAFCPVETDDESD
jgi:hypothetical protein